MVILSVEAVVLFQHQLNFNCPLYATLFYSMHHLRTIILSRSLST